MESTAKPRAKTVADAPSSNQSNYLKGKAPGIVYQKIETLRRWLGFSSAAKLDEWFKNEELFQGPFDELWKSAILPMVRVGETDRPKLDRLVKRLDGKMLFFTGNVGKPVNS